VRLARVGPKKRIPNENSGLLPNQKPNLQEVYYEDYWQEAKTKKPGADDAPGFFLEYQLSTINAKIKSRLCIYNLVND
jgi:hypothetical protein